MDYGHGGNIYSFSEKLNVDKNQIIDFSSNINWYGPPKEIAELIRTNIDGINRYPDIENKLTIENISDYYKLSKKNILLGNGSAELIFLLVKILRIDKAIIIEPNFSEYREACQANQINVKSLIGNSESNFKIEIDEILKQAEKNSLIFISSPNNPVGYIYSSEEISRLTKELEKREALLFVDEAFTDFLSEPNSSTSVDKIGKYENLIILKSLTKILSVPGIRLGSIIASEKIITKMRRSQPPWSVNYFAQLIGENISIYKKFINLSKKKIIKDKKELIKQLEQIKSIQIFKGEVNFILFEIIKQSPQKISLEKFLSAKKIMIRNCTNYLGLSEFYYRIALRNKKDNTLLADLLKEYFDE